MSEESDFQQMMENKYPKMFSGKYGGFDVGPGWYPIIKSLCANIQSHIDWWNKNHEKHPVVEQVVVEQIKEKLGTLRFYYSGGDDYIRGLVTQAESCSGITCETCGNRGSLRTGGWMKTLCDHHHEEREQARRNSP